MKAFAVLFLALNAIAQPMPQAFVAPPPMTRTLAWEPAIGATSYRARAFSNGVQFANLILATNRAVFSNSPMVGFTALISSVFDQGPTVKPAFTYESAAVAYPPPSAGPITLRLWAQSAASLSGPWLDMTTNPIVTISNAVANRFYRLRIQ